MGRRGRTAVAVLGAAAIAGLAQAEPAWAAASTEQFTFTHTSGQRVTCSIAYGHSDNRDDHGEVTAWTRIESTDPRCAAGVDVALAYQDIYGNDQSAGAEAGQHVFLQVFRVGDDFTSVHRAFFTQCRDPHDNVCWTGEVLQAK